MCKIPSKKKLLFFFIAIVLLICGVFLAREPLLRGVGAFLVHSDKPEKADLIVMLRGGFFDRSMQAAELYKRGYAGKVLLLRSLADNMPGQFAEHGIRIHDNQSRLRGILIQAGVKEEDIITSKLTPGGGTIGEARRVKAELLRLLDVRTIIVVTSWYHTHRSHRIYSAVFKDSGIKVQLVASKFGIDNATNWWHYRYVTLNVLTEIPKLILSYINPVTNIPFKDDPAKQS